MKHINPIEAARSAVASNPARPAIQVISDSADARIVVFRLAPGQNIASHRNASSVFITVLSGRGVLAGEEHGKVVERVCVAGDLLAYAPNEAHSMRAEDEELMLLATITPRPGERNASH